MCWVLNYMTVDLSLVRLVTITIPRQSNCLNIDSY